MGLGLGSKRRPRSLSMNHATTHIYWTISVRLTVRVSPALVAVAAIVYVPAGVTGDAGGFGSEPLSSGIVRPTPHPVAAAREASTRRPAKKRRRPLRRTAQPNGNNIASEVIPNCLKRNRALELVAVTPVRTVTETAVAPPSMTVDGVTVQVALAGAPEQVKLAVPGTFAAELSSKGYTAF